ncbi:MAG TPA: hypothetical protein VM677_32855 [Actinokineospora sp.]|nr:hypothetical protein [Actinokineospora sp.]
MANIIRKSVAALALTSALTAGTAAVTNTVADASVASCGGGRCTLYFSKSETRALGYGTVPPPPAATPWQLRAAYYALAYGHRWFAQQYANRGMCSAFTLSVYPWETQGYFGYACNWN